MIDDRALLIGATAIVHDITLITRNKEHFDRLRRYGLKIG